MTSAADWLNGARPRTLPAAVAPVLVGTGAAAAVGALRPGRALLALGVALALQVAVNYANDYSDGIRGTDAGRVGPQRLTASGLAAPSSVRGAALAAFLVAAALGLVLVVLTGAWWLVAVGAAAIFAAWFYTGGRAPYGYRGLGELSVFVFFGLVATVGTTFVQAMRVTSTSVAGGVAMGCFASALLTVNNLRDIPTDRAVGKRTLAVRLGDALTRRLFVLLLVLPFVVASALAVGDHPRAVWAWLAVPLALRAARPVLEGAIGAPLVASLRDTAQAQLLFASLLAVTVAL